MTATIAIAAAVLAAAAAHLGIVALIEHGATAAADRLRRKDAAEK